MVKLIEWDADLLKSVDVSYFIKWTTRDAGANIFGVPQVVTPSMGVWQVDLNLGRETDATTLKRFEAYVSQMRGRYNVASIPICDPYKYGHSVSPKQWPFSDGTWFTDGTGFADSGNAIEPLVLTADVTAGDTQLYVDLANPVKPSLRVGDMFSIYGYLYRVIARNSAGWVQFEPPARRNVATGVPLTLNPPRFYGRFADDNQGRRMRERLRFGQEITLSFVEAFDRTFE